MSAHSVQFEATDGGLVLANAILLYRSESGQAAQLSSASRAASPAFASIHHVEHHGGRPTIAAGAPLTRAQLRSWADALGKSAVPEILPANVLVSHPDVLAWWVPERVRPTYFALSEPPKGLRALGERKVVALPCPAHLFLATRSNLSVFALPANERPTRDTVVLHSPILNVYLDGRLCWGNISRPKALSLSAIPEFERAVFDSWSTHPNPGQELTVTGKGGLVRLWDDLAARGAKSFPVNRLKPFNPSTLRRGDAVPVTLGRLIAESAQS